MIVLHELPVRNINVSELPILWRVGSRYPKGNTYVECGPVKIGGNEPYCYTEEKACAGHICRVLCPDKVLSHATVIRDDDTVWQIDFNCFQEIYLLSVE